MELNWNGFLSRLRFAGIFNWLCVSHVVISISFFFVLHFLLRFSFCWMSFKYTWFIAKIRGNEIVGLSRILMSLFIHFATI